MITIVIVDDHKIVRQGIRSLLETENDLRVVGEASNGADGFRLVDGECPNILISDLSMEGMNGIELCEKVRASASSTECIILSMHGDDPYVMGAIRAGAKGYVLKENGLEDVINAVRAVSLKKVFLSKPLDERMAEMCSADSSFNRSTCQDILEFRSNATNVKVPAASETPGNSGTRLALIQSENGAQAAAIASLEEQVQVLRGLALMDELTAAGNRRFANNSLQTKIEELRRYGWAFGAILLDLDDFKQINDKYGHAAGDQVLKRVAETVGRSVRSHNSYFFRWGGDEFLIIASNVNRNQLFELSERIRVLVSNTAVTLTSEVRHVSVSLGMSMANADDSAEKLMSRIDAGLYLGKHQGKNRGTPSP
jgi:diguanylate cyclase (GGDEF)-like protein